MSYPELEKEQLRSENKLHLLRIISESNDPELKKLNIDDLTNVDVDIWGSYRDILVTTEQTGNKETVSPEESEELYKKIKVNITELNSAGTAQPFLRSFLRNKLTVISSGLMLLKDMPDEWASYYTEFIVSDIETYK